MALKFQRIDHNCNDYTIYKAGGYFSCEHCGEEYFFTELGLKAKDLEQYYEYWNNPKDVNYENDKDMMEWLKKCESITKKEIKN